MDHAHFGGRLLLVAVDAYSKWPEVHVVFSMSAQQTIDKLHVMVSPLYLSLRQRLTIPIHRVPAVCCI